MEKRFLKFLLFGVFTLVFSIAFTGCGDDYDDDIKGLESKNASMQTAIDALNTAKTALETSVAAANSKADAAVEAAKLEAVKAAKEEIANMMDVPGTSAEEVAAVLGQLMELSKGLSSITPAVKALTGLKDELVTKADANPSWIEVIIGYNGRIAALELQMSALENYGEGETVKGDISKLKADLESQISALTPGGEGSMTDARVKEIVEGMVAEALAANGWTMEDIINKINEVNPGLVTLEGVYKMITGISIVQTADATNPRLLSFNVAEIKAGDWTFGGNYVGAITFGQAGKLQNITSTVVVQVTPANAAFNASMVSGISLVDSKGNDISQYVTAKTVQPYTGLLTRGTLPSTGLYEVTFELDGAAYDEANFNKAVGFTYTNGPSNSFAVAVKTGEVSDRYVLSDFGLKVKSAGAASAVYALPLTNFNFTVKGSDGNSWNIGSIKNRYTDTNEKVWKSGTTDFTNPEKNTEKGDKRTDYRSLLVKVGEPFEVTMDIYSNIKDAYAYYIEIDNIDNASATEKPLWESSKTTVSGMNQVYRIGETARLTITDPNMKGRQLGFRVRAVNYDGTLVDPDGRSFYVICDQDITATTLKFKTNITEYITMGGTVKTAAVDISIPADVNLNSIDNHTLNMTIEDQQQTWLPIEYFTNAADKVKDTDPSIAYWSNAKSIRIGGITPSSLREGVTYKGVLTLRDRNQMPLVVYNIELTKELPTGIPSKKPNTVTTAGAATANGYSYAISNNGNQTIRIIPGAVLKSDGSKLDKANYTFTYNEMNTLFGPDYASNARIILPTVTGVKQETATTPVAGEQIILSSGYDSETLHSIQIEYNYGNVLFDQTKECKVTAASDIKVQFASIFAGYEIKYNSTATDSKEPVTLILNGNNMSIALGAPLQWKPFVGGSDFTAFKKAQFETYVNTTKLSGQLSYYDTDDKKMQSVDLSFGGFDSSNNPIILIPVSIAKVNAMGKLYNLTMTLTDLLGGISKIEANLMIEVGSVDDPDNMTIKVTPVVQP